MYEIHLSKETFKFSCSHFTILASDRAERLHGHNYQLRIDISVPDTDPKLGMAFDFNAVKPSVRGFCDRLDERILLPQNSPYLQLKTQGPQIEVSFQNKRYSFPTEDTIVLPLSNITSEELARFAAMELKKSLSSVAGWKALRVHIEETRGQSVSYTLER